MFREQLHRLYGQKRARARKGVRKLAALGQPVKAMWGENVDYVTAENLVRQNGGIKNHGACNANLPLAGALALLFGFLLVVA